MSKGNAIPLHCQQLSGRKVESAFYPNAIHQTQGAEMVRNDQVLSPRAVQCLSVFRFVRLSIPECQLVSSGHSREAPPYGYPQASMFRSSIFSYLILSSRANRPILSVC